MKKKKAAKAKKPAAKKAKAKKPAAKKPAAKKPARKAGKPKGATPWQAHGYAVVTPYLTVIDVEKALLFCERAFGFPRKTAMPGPGGQIVHGEVTVGDMRIMMGMPNPAQGDKAPAAFGGTPVTLYVYVPDVDAAFERARGAGATVHLSPTDMFWGDRIASLEDPEGHRWTLATHVRTLSPAELRKAMEAMSGGAPSHEHAHEHGGTSHSHAHDHAHDHGHGASEHDHGHDGHGDGHGHAHEESRPSHS